MTNQKQDAKIAVLIEDKPESDRLVAYSPGGAWYRDTVIIIDRDNRSRQGHWKPRPFISASTWELEGIVLEYMQGLHPLKTLKYWGWYEDLLNERIQHKDGWISGRQLFHYHKMGMWALALLKVLKNGRL